ncbi:MAG: hypothetical protein RR316_01070 [Clostridia bacterium]
MNYKFALIGQNVSLSPSAFIHNRLFELNNTNASYDLISLPTLNSKHYEEINSYYDGFNVTAPYKQTVLKYIAKKDENLNFNAINTVKKGIGYNTDIYGANKALTDFQADMYNEILLIGNGGVAKAFMALFIKNNANVTIAVRNEEKGAAFIKEFQYANSRMINLNDINKNYDLIVNATTIGQINDTKLIDDSVIKKSGKIFDAVYFSNKTILEKSADKYKIPYLNGLSMLIYQAAYAQQIWINQPLLDDTVLKQLILDTKNYLRS